MIKLTCDLCKKQIPNGAAYACITYNIENMTFDPVAMVPEVEVISSDQIFTMCGKCGNKRNAAAVKAVLKTTLQTESPQLN